MSRTLGRRLTSALAAHLEQRLDGVEVLALFLDGVVVAGQTVIVVLGLTREPRSAVCLGSTGGGNEHDQPADDSRGHR